MAHALYDDEALVDATTRAHIDAGRTVFQLWMTRPTEREHATQVLDMIAPPHRARILSLGCGVAGMEAYWQDQRPDMRFTLVNNSTAQLALLQCSGPHVSRHLCDAHEYSLIEGQRPHDVAVLAYVLGHCKVGKVLDRAMEATNGKVVVLDVFDASSAFIRTMQYDAPESAVLANLGFKRCNVPGWHMSPFVAEDARALGVISQAMPAMWIHHA
jgi:trans-aconitate methyltransferase